MLDDRKTAILRAVVEEYIATAQPVGSAHIANNRDLAVCHLFFLVTGINI